MCKSASQKILAKFISFEMRIITIIFFTNWRRMIFINKVAGEVSDRRQRK